MEIGLRFVQMQRASHSTQYQIPNKTDILTTKVMLCLRIFMPKWAQIVKKDSFELGYLTNAVHTLFIEMDAFLYMLTR